MSEEITQYFLDNGLKVIIKTDFLSPVTSIFVWINTGSAYEDDSQRGIAHVNEHMIFKGTPNLKVGEISRQIESHGGDINAFTSYDETVYYTTISNDFADIALNILSESVSNPLFDEDELKKELEVILEEIKRGEDSPSRCLSQMIFSQSFKDNNYGLPIIGTPKSVSRFKREDLEAFYNKWYHAKNMNLIVVTGKEGKDLKDNIDATFGKIKSKDVADEKFSDKFQATGLNVDVDYREVNETYFALSFRTEKASNMKTSTLDLFGVMLGSGESSILNKKLKEELGLVTSIYSYNFSARHGGVFVIGGTVLSSNLKDSLKLIIEETRKVINLDFDSNQFQRAKTELLTQNLYENETVQSQAQKIGFLESEAGSLDFEKIYLDSIKSISPEKLSEISNQFIKPENLSLNLILPKDSKKESSEQLKILLKKSFKEELSYDKKTFSSFVSKNYNTFDIDYSVPKVLNLKGGVKLIVLQNKKTPLISLRSVSLGGSKFETKNINGKFNLLSELFTRGSENYSKDYIAMNTEILAAEIEGFSGRNSLGLKMIGPSANLNELVPIFSDVIARPVFSDSEIKIAKKDVLSYLNRKKQNYASIVADKFFELLFNNHPYSFDQFGTEESIANINRDNLVRAHQNFISKNNIYLSAVGNFDVVELVDKLDESLLLEQAKTDFPNNDDCKLINHDINESIKMGDKEQSHIIIGTYAPNLHSDDKYAFHLINSILSGMGGRLFMELREKRSLAYTVSSFFNPNLDYGYFGVYIGCSPDKKNQSIDSINKEIENLASNGVTEKELERAKNYLIGRNDISLQRNSSINARISHAALYNLDLTEPFDFSEKIRKVSQESINKAIQNYLYKKNKVTVSVDPA